MRRAEKQLSRLRVAPPLPETVRLVVRPPPSRQLLLYPPPLLLRTLTAKTRLALRPRFLVGLAHRRGGRRAQRLPEQG